ncbi:MAG: hypothetical protein JNN23_17350 [Chryseobacterium gambrini]|nr:hypothetical protein [Chryseobacterium gambrini]
MKLFNTKNIIKLLAVLFIAITAVSCQRDGSAAEDDLPQEDLTNIILLVTEDVPNAVTKTYNYSMGAGGNPTIQVQDGKTYNVEVQFKNGNEDATQEIKDAKEEHFLVYNFPNSDITLTRTDDSSSTYNGIHVGLKTKWVVNKAVNNASSTSQLILTLFHEPASVTEAATVSGNGVIYGTQVGGETDAQANYTITN